MTSGLPGSEETKNDRSEKEGKKERKSEKSVNSLPPPENPNRLQNNGGKSNTTERGEFIKRQAGGRQCAKEQKSSSRNEKRGGHCRLNDGGDVERKYREGKPPGLFSQSQTNKKLAEPVD